MSSAAVLRSARRQAGWTQRELALAAATSHGTLAAYERGTKAPRLDTLGRVVDAAGFVLELRLVPRPDAGWEARVAKGRELAEALALAEAFPLRDLPRQLPRRGIPPSPGRVARPATSP